MRDADQAPLRHEPRGRHKGAAAAVRTLMLAGTFAAGCAEAPSGPTPLEMLPRELTAAEQEVISASNRFAFGLFRETDRLDGEGNIFLSPVSATLALGMTMNGARGETLTEMRAALGFGPLELRQINESYRGLMELLLGLDPGVDVRIANSIWYRDTFPFEQSFFDTAREYFSAEVAGLQMVDSDRDIINDWVSRATNGKIPEIVDEIRRDHVMFLINGVYFKGSWTERFDPAVTRDDEFLLSSGETTRVSMMSGKPSFGHRWMDGYEVIDLPYGGGAFSMTILLPAPGEGVDDLVASLDVEEWRAATNDLPVREMDLYLPRFRVEYKQELNDALKALGMESAFVPGGADFTGMSASAGHDLSISRVLQKSYVDVNEEGTEAAAATSVEMVVTSLPPSVRVDRPFVFAIRERFSSTILFIGKIVDPS